MQDRKRRTLATDYNGVQSLPHPNFERPSGPLFISGFRLQFRRYPITATYALWLPTHVHRNEQTRGWKISFSHREGKYLGWVGDNGRPMLKSLDDAWKHLSGALQLHQPARASSIPRPSRRGKFYTGVMGVHIERVRGSAQRSHGVLVRVSQRVQDEGKGVRSTHVNTFYVREPRFRDDPSHYEAEFRRALCVATALRRLHDEIYHATGPLGRRLVPTDVPLSSVPEAPVVDLRLEAIFDSF